MAAGFKLSLAPTTSATTPRSHFHFNESEVVFNYPVGGGSYPNYDKVSMVFQQNGPNYLEITRLETESTYDRVLVYTVYPYYTRKAAVLEGRWV